MKTNADIQLLRDPDIQPTDDVISAGLGGANGAFVKFLDGLKAHGITLMDWRYYNDGKAWLSKGEYRWTTARGVSKVKPVFWLSVWDGFFKVSFFFGCDVREELLTLPLCSETKALIQNAVSMGKTMRFLPIVLDISDESKLCDAYELAEFRKIRVK